MPACLTVYLICELFNAQVLAFTKTGDHLAFTVGSIFLPHYCFNRKKRGSSIAEVSSGISLADSYRPDIYDIGSCVVL